jgi:S1-C subfamily serine protease
MKTFRTCSPALRVLFPLLTLAVVPPLRGQSGLVGLEKSVVAAAAAARQGVVPLLVHRHRSSSKDHSQCLYRIASAVLVDGSGLALSTASAALEGSEIELIVGDRRLPAQLLGVDPVTRVCALRLGAPAPELRPLPTADASSLAPGRIVMLMGYSGSFMPQLSLALVSGVGECIVSGKLGSFLQLNPLGPPPDQGGAVLDLDGRLVAVFPGQPEPDSASGLPSGPGRTGATCYAIPFETARQLGTELSDHGRVRRPWLGVTILGPNLRLGDLVGLAREAALQISRVEPGSPAAQAGVRASDRILAFDGQPISNLPDLIRRIEQAGIDRIVTLRLERAGQILETSVRVAERPTSGATAPTTVWIGLRLVNQPPGAKRPGVLVQEVVDSALANWLGLQSGDLLVSLNGQMVEDVAQFDESSWLTPASGRIVVEADRQGRPVRVEFSPLEVRTDPGAVLLRLLQLEHTLGNLLGTPPPASDADPGHSP